MKTQTAATEKFHQLNHGQIKIKQDNLHKDEVSFTVSSTFPLHQGGETNLAINDTALSQALPCSGIQ